MLSHFVDDRTEAQRNRVVKISKKILEKKIVTFSRLGSSPSSTALQEIQQHRDVPPQPIVQVAGNKDEGAVTGESPRANAAHAADMSSLCFSARCPVEWDRGPET